MSDTKAVDKPELIEPKSPFDDPYADIILRSCDGADFRVYKTILSLASPFFQTMFSLPGGNGKGSAGGELKDGLPVISLFEDFRTLDFLLRSCYPRRSPKPEDLDLEGIGLILDALQKYEIDAFDELGESLLRDLIDEDPVGVFFIAHSHGLEDVARMAAKWSLKRPFLFSRSSQFRYMTADQLYDFLQYRHDCGVAASAVTTSSMDWISNCSDTVTNYRSACKKCYGALETRCYNYYAPKFVLEYLSRAGPALKDQPHEDVIFRDGIYPTSFGSCTDCRTDRGTGMIRFCQLFADEIKRVVAALDHWMSFRYHFTVVCTRHYCRPHLGQGRLIALSDSAFGALIIVPPDPGIMIASLSSLCTSFLVITVLRSSTLRESGLLFEVCPREVLWSYNFCLAAAGFESAMSSDSAAAPESRPKASSPPAPQSNASRIHDAEAPFNDPRADIILRSCDHVDFRVYKTVLSLASPFFETMFALPEPASSADGECDERKDNAIVIPVAEKSHTLDILLLSCYPRHPPVITGLHEIREVLEAAQKYEIGCFNHIAEATLRTLIKGDPIGVYSVACGFGFVKVAAASARWTLQQPLMTFSSTEVRHITGEQYHNLLQYHRACGVASKNVPATRHWFISCNDTLTEHPRCSSGCYVNRGGWNAPQFLWDYLERVGRTLKEKPCGAVVTSDDNIVPASCLTTCQHSNYNNNKNVVDLRNGLNKFCRPFAAEIDRVIAECFGHTDSARDGVWYLTRQEH
ncbi:hypothetical protein EW146_g8139 [Bondarzewia mesenterica]|uniref:BTB domain-containing protein n=1 Tax=Bondarzewia mesenterica TaxID=1095465 RepID=A0A4S4LIL9_9AGAM|nr:hypothetical protein EW146_g8139 [Bondarzewia mesenterica]